ncbi:ABC transporter substrate-binding protein [Mycobacterium sp. 1274756.6]|uniref:ABC transporter substrate-binding protein n=1 Tax=Mycobacterium sp. 1274756.6 TaxID=1834076 RepID=UPI0007FBBFEE|nr:ABC transporter substrate-binding protein [Mycobacterium sp. 1274756.6]OBJ71651.1 ABC transporter substrate-binding protein [Mycobacterium sp. 1274756.6]
MSGVRAARSRWLRVIGPALAVGAITAGCVQNADESDGLPAVPVTATRVDAIAATVPAPIADAGRLVIGVNLPQPPNQFHDARGRVVGFDIDLMDAVAAVLGLTTSYQQADFEKIIPAVRGGTFDVGIASFTDTVERERVVDFVTYFATGTLWTQRPGPPIDPDDACGLRVAVQTATMADTHEIPAKSAACELDGRPPIEKVKFERQDVATNALLLGRVDAMSADHPVARWAIDQTDGRLIAAGESAGLSPYGWPVAKGSALAESLRLALTHLIDTGDYRAIAQAWNLESGMIRVPVINGALA